MEPTPPELEPTAAPVTIPLDERIASIVALAPKPLDFGKIKKALKEAGVPLKGKEKVDDSAIQAAIDASVAAGKAFLHPHKKPEGKPSYWHKVHVTKAELAAEKAKLIEEKIAEKARAKAAEVEAKAKAKTDAIEAKAKAKTDAIEAKAKAKADAAEEKARQKAAEAEQATQRKAAEVAETVHRKAAELGHKPVAEKHLGQPKPNAGPAELDAFKTTVEKLLAEGKLHRHGEKYGKHAPVVIEWYEAKPLRKPFEDAVKAARAILAAGTVDFDEVVKCLKLKLDEAPAVVEAAEPVVETTPGAPAA